jgi:hypothetical protein
MGANVCSGFIHDEQQQKRLETADRYLRGASVVTLTRRLQHQRALHAAVNCCPKGNCANPQDVREVEVPVAFARCNAMESGTGLVGPLPDCIVATREGDGDFSFPTILGVRGSCAAGDACCGNVRHQVQPFRVATRELGYWATSH